MRRLTFLVLASLGLAGCGGGSSGSPTAGKASGQTVSISEMEYSLTPSSVKIANTGTVTFKVTNDGQVAHALEIEGNGVKEETDTIQPGQSATLKVSIDKSGEYEMYCPIDGHKSKGMKGSVTVGSSMSGGTGDDTTTNEGTTTEDSPGY